LNRSYLEYVVQRTDDLLSRDCPPHPREGLCSFILSGVGRFSARVVRDWMKLKFSGWELYGGSEDYPVPHPRYVNPKEAYEQEPLWDRRTTYGKNRWKLVEYINKEAKRELKGLCNE